jgi:hypothetical protein
MVDLQFGDVVRESRETRTVEDGVLVNRGWRAMCKTCSTVHKVDVSEFDVPVTTFSNGEKHIPIDEAVFRFVAEMRAWNCCHEGAEPYDGFPDEPDAPYGIELGHPGE